MLHLFPAVALVDEYCWEFKGVGFLHALACIRHHGMQCHRPHHSVSVIETPWRHPEKLPDWWVRIGVGVGGMGNGERKESVRHNNFWGEIRDCVMMPYHLTAISSSGAADVPFSYSHVNILHCDDVLFHTATSASGCHSSVGQYIS